MTAAAVNNSANKLLKQLNCNKILNCKNNNLFIFHSFFFSLFYFVLFACVLFLSIFFSLFFILNIATVSVYHLNNNSKNLHCTCCRPQQPTRASPHCKKTNKKLNIKKKQIKQPRANKKLQHLFPLHIFSTFSIVGFSSSRCRLSPHVMRPCRSKHWAVRETGKISWQCLLKDTKSITLSENILSSSIINDSDCFNQKGRPKAGTILKILFSRRKGGIPR